MKSKLFNLDDLEKASTIESATISTPLGLIYCSLRRTLLDGSFESILGQPVAMYKSASDPKLRNYAWETDSVTAELTIGETDAPFATVASRHVLQWRVESRDPNLELSCRVGFSEGPHLFSYYDGIGDQAHQGVIWTNEDFIDGSAPTAAAVAIAGWFDREVCVMSDKWGVYTKYLHQNLSELPTGVFAVASAQNVREAYSDPELSGVLRLNKSQLSDLNHSVDPLG